MFCDQLISYGIKLSCATPIVKGFEPDGIIINRADIDFTQSSFDANHEGTIVLKSGKTGFPIAMPVNNPYEGSEITLNVGTYANTWTKNIQVILLSVGSGTSKLVDELVNGDVVLILRNKTKTDVYTSTESGGNPASSEYEVFGFEQGMKASAGTRTPNDDETLGGTLLTLTETNAPSHGLFLWTTSKSATDAAYASLLPQS